MWMKRSRTGASRSQVPMPAGVMVGEPQQIIANFAEGAFDAYNLTPDPHLANGLPTDIYGPEPSALEGIMMWTAPPGVSGIVPVKPPPDAANLSAAENLERLKTIRDVHQSDRHTTHELYGHSVRHMLESGHAALVKDFRIAYTIMWPKEIPRGSKRLETIPMMLLLHGVPMNRRTKYKIMRWVARFCVCVCVDMLGMGESDMPLEYGRLNDIRANTKSATNPSDPMDYEAFQREFIWKNDLPYIHQLMMEHVPETMGIAPAPFIFQADDWGTGIAMSYASHHRYTKDLRMLFLLNAVMLDGYFVIEIGAIGKLAELFHRDPEGFSAMAPIIPQTILGIEKYMVVNRKRMNNYTERNYLYPYQDTNYQGGKTAAAMHHSEWAILSLANRSSRLAPRQLQPWHRTKNPHGIKTWNMKAPVHFIWGREDQMMPPAQIDRGMMLWPAARHVAGTEVADADHFVEIDQPEEVSRIMMRSINGTLGFGTTRTFLGIPGDDIIYKGDEAEFAKRMNAIYGVSQ